MISMKKFYLLAGILMLIAFFANLWTLSHSWTLMLWGGRISFIFGTLLFELLLISLFFGMWKMTPQLDIKSVDLSSVLNDFENKNIKRR